MPLTLMLKSLSRSNYCRLRMASDTNYLFTIILQTITTVLPSGKTSGLRRTTWQSVTATSLSKVLQMEPIIKRLNSSIMEGRILIFSNLPKVSCMETLTWRCWYTLSSPTSITITASSLKDKIHITMNSVSDLCIREWAQIFGIMAVEKRTAILKWLTTLLLTPGQPRVLG
jgi:hypothetical protein